MSEKVGADISQRLFQMRQEMGLTRRDFSKKVRIPEKTLENWEKKRRMPPEYIIDMLEEIQDLRNQIEELNHFLSKQSMDEYYLAWMKYGNYTIRSVGRSEKEAYKGILNGYVKLVDNGISDFPLLLEDMRDVACIQKCPLGKGRLENINETILPVGFKP